MAKKPSIGRQKIKMAKIEIKNHLQVTFSKRRSGLFKKASELCTLCGVEIAIVVFSPAGKVFSFGHPNVEPIVDRFLNRNHHPLNNSSNNNNTPLHFVEAHRNASVRDLNFQLMQTLNQLEVEKKRGEALDHLRKCSQSQFWWEAPVNELGSHELEQLKDSMEELKKSLKIQATKILAEAAAASSSSSSHPLALFAGSNDNMGAIIDHHHHLHNHFETKPAQIDFTQQAAVHVHNFGYAAGHGYF